MTRTIDIYETKVGWTMRGRRYQTAAGVVRAIRRQDRQHAASHPGEIVATTIQWHSISVVGDAIAQSFGAKNE